MNTKIFNVQPQTDTQDGFFGQNAGIPDSVIVDPVSFDAPAFTEEETIASLSEALQEDAPTFIDDAGRIHIEGEANTENMLRVDGSVFGAPNPEEELEQLAKALQEDDGDGYFVDEYGRIRLGSDPSVASSPNLTKVDGNVFGAPTPEEELEQLAKALQEDDGDGYFVDEYGRIRLGSDPSVASSPNLTKVDGNVFGAPTPEEELEQLAKALQEDDGDGYFVDEYGRIRLGSDPSVASSPNLTKVDGNVFGAHEDQWYKKNPQLFRAEVATMRQHYPKAGYDFYQNNGNMYWVVTLKILNTPGVVKPWVFQLVYDKDHPHNHGYGGSIKVVPLRPSLDDLKKIALQHGRPAVPHVINNESHFLKRYLCTRFPKDIADGTDIIASATQAAAWAADWAAHFEVGIRDACVWNKWCNDSHFRHMQVTCKKPNCPHRSCPYGKRG